MLLRLPLWQTLRRQCHRHRRCPPVAPPLACPRSPCPPSRSGCQTQAPASAAACVNTLGATVAQLLCHHGRPGGSRRPGDTMPCLARFPPPSPLIPVAPFSALLRLRPALVVHCHEVEKVERGRAGERTQYNAHYSAAASRPGPAGRGAHGKEGGAADLGSSAALCALLGFHVDGRMQFVARKFGEPLHAQWRQRRRRTACAWRAAGYGRFCIWASQSSASVSAILSPSRRLIHQPSRVVWGRRGGGACSTGRAVAARLYIPPATY